jgi:hypothetical protein
VGNWLVAQAVTLLQEQMPQMGRALVGRDPADGSTWLRVMLRARERQPAAAKRAVIDQVRGIVAAEFPGGPGRQAGEVTGFFVLLAQLVDRLLADQWLTFLLATAGIFLVLAASFRSLLLAAIALVPNALPIFVVLGLLGWSGERVNMGTAMIAAVSMGLSVDSSIHYLVAAVGHRGRPCRRARRRPPDGRSCDDLLDAGARGRIPRAHDQQFHADGVLRLAVLPYARRRAHRESRRSARALGVGRPVALALRPTALPEPGKPGTTTAVNGFLVRSLPHG